MELEQGNEVADFAKRTRCNLEIVREYYANNPDKKEYATTQLINSLLGLLIFPRQEYSKRFRNGELPSVSSEKFPIESITSDPKSEAELIALISQMRHAIAHYHVDFMVDDNKQIIGLRLWTENKQNNKDWGMEFTLKELEDLTTKLLEVLEKQKA